MVKRIALLFFCILLLSVFTISAWNFPSTSTGTSAVTISTTTITGNLTNFTELWDTPDAYAGDGGDCVKVNAGETGLEFDVCGAVSETDPKAYNGTLMYTSNYTDWNVSGYIKNWNSTSLIQNWSLIITATNEVDPKWTGNYSSVITEPLWSANYTNLNSTWSSTYNATYDAFNSTGLIKDWNSTSYIIDWNISTYLRNWNSTGLIQNWSLIISGASETDPLWSANYTNLNSTWSSTYNATYNAYNSTGLIKDWNASSYIIDWNISTYLRNWNVTGYIINWSEYLSGTIYTHLSNFSNNVNYWNSTFADFNKSYADTLYCQISEPLWSANYTNLNATWSSMVNTSYGLATEPLWSANYTNLNATWSSIKNDSYRLFTNGTFTSDVNITTGNLSVTNRIKLAIGDCSGLVAGEICRNATAIYIQG